MKWMKICLGLIICKHQRSWDPVNFISSGRKEGPGLDVVCHYRGHETRAEWELTRGAYLRWRADAAPPVRNLRNDLLSEHWHFSLKLTSKHISPQSIKIWLPGKFLSMTLLHTVKLIRRCSCQLLKCMSMPCYSQVNLWSVMLNNISFLDNEQNVCMTDCLTLILDR